MVDPDAILDFADTLGAAWNTIAAAYRSATEPEEYTGFADSDEWLAWCQRACPKEEVCA